MNESVTHTLMNQVLSVLKGINFEIVGIKSEMVGMKDDIKDIKSDVVHLKSEIVGIKSEIAGMKDDIKDIKSDVVHLKSEIVGIKSEIVGIKSDIAGMKDDIKDIKSDVVHLKSEIVGIKSEIVGIKSDIAGMNIQSVASTNQLREIKASLARVNNGASALRVHPIMFVDPQQPENGTSTSSPLPPSCYPKSLGELRELSAHNVAELIAFYDIKNVSSLTQKEKGQKLAVFLGAHEYL
jgi:archaellum component FlaC